MEDFHRIHVCAQKMQLLQCSANRCTWFVKSNERAHMVANGILFISVFDFLRYFCIYLLLHTVAKAGKINQWRRQKRQIFFFDFVFSSTYFVSCTISFASLLHFLNFIHFFYFYFYFYLSFIYCWFLIWDYETFHFIHTDECLMFMRTHRNDRSCFVKVNIWFVAVS